MNCQRRLERSPCRSPKRCRGQAQQRDTLDLYPLLILVRNCATYSSSCLTRNRHLHQYPCSKAFRQGCMKRCQEKTNASGSFRISANTQDYYLLRLRPTFKRYCQGPRDSSSSCIYSVGESTTMMIDIEIISVRVCLLQDCFPKQTMTRCFNLCRWHPTPQTSRLLQSR